MLVPQQCPPLVCVVGFHHARGPEIETWLGAPTGTDPTIDNDWNLLPFMALSDGSHASVEDFSYFTLRRAASSGRPATSAFGISCTRQIDAATLIERPDDVTRSTVQKAVVAIADSPQLFGQLREKLSMVTGAWFAQRDFSDVQILKDFQENLVTGLKDAQDDLYLGLPLRELIYEYRQQTLVMFKCCLLQPKMLFFGSKCERLCMVQFALISLIPGLLKRLQDSADPDFDSCERNVIIPTSLKTSERASLLSYMGLPLQLFGKGSLFCPYIPLQQLDMLADHGTKSYIVGSTNSLLLQQKDRYSDILINLDDSTVNITSPSLRNALGFTAADRRWIDFLTQTVVDSWDENNPSRPKTMGYMGSEEFIRLQFEEYLLALLSSVKYQAFNQKSESVASDQSEGDPVADFNSEWVHAWKATPSYALFDKTTDSHLFDIVEPRHPTAGNMTIDDVQRRVAQQIQVLNLDEKLATGKEVLNKHLATGQKKVSTAITHLWADIEALREAQRRRQEEARTTADVSSRTGSPAPSESRGTFTSKVLATRAPDMAAVQASAHAAGQKAGSYLSSWGAWASEKSKTWAKQESEAASVTTADGKNRSSQDSNKLSKRSSRDILESQKEVNEEEKGADGIGRLDA